MRVLILGFALYATAAPAQGVGPTVLDPAAVIALGQEPWRDRAAFLDRLEAVLGPVSLDMPRLPEALRDTDPFLWSLMGRFGAPLQGSTVAGGIVACSRYGLATRDRLAATGLSDPGAFSLFAATQPAPDDAAAWPEAGLARLACMITWDDTRRVAIIPEDAARVALESVFAQVTRSGDAEVYGDRWQDYAPLYGDRGYRLDAQVGPQTSVAIHDRALIELRVSHQTIRFRAFLLNGGV
jgi:hypothetical protein